METTWDIGNHGTDLELRQAMQLFLKSIKIYTRTKDHEQTIYENKEKRSV